MKRIKFLAAVMAVALVLLPLGINTIEASAEEPTTYSVMYLDEFDDWRFQKGGDFDPEKEHRELYYFYEQVKDGDVVVVYNPVSDNTPALDLGTKSLSNLTVCHSAGFTVINCGRIDEFYTLANTACSVNAPYITTAHIYDGTTCSLNCDVGTLNFYISDDINSTIGCGGTVGHLYGYSVTAERVDYDFYNFKANTLQIVGGGLQTPEECFSRTAPAATPTPAPAPAAPSTSGSASSGSDYDDVPKTGDSSMAMCLFLAAVLCAGGSYLLGKKAQ